MKMASYADYPRERCEFPVQSKTKRRLSARPIVHAIPDFRNRVEEYPDIFSGDSPRTVSCRPGECGTILDAVWRRDGPWCTGTQYQSRLRVRGFSLWTRNA